MIIGLNKRVEVRSISRGSLRRERDVVVGEWGYLGFGLAGPQE